MIDDCCNLMVDEIKEKHGELSAKELGEVYDFLKSGSEKYEPVDGDNRLETAFKEFVSVTKGRTRLTKNGGYVKVAEYYRNKQQ